MGHIRLGNLPNSKKWREVVELLSDGASIDVVASASAHAARKELKRGSEDPIFGFVAQLLVKLPLMARASDCEARLHDLGFREGAFTSVSEFTSQLTLVTNSFAFDEGRFSDFGDIATSALVESLGIKLRERLPTLFEPAPSEIRQALGQFAGGGAFAELARDFFARVTYRTLDYYLSRGLSAHTGEGARFESDSGRRNFERALFQHTYESSKIVEAFAGGWYGKTVWKEQNLSEDAIRKFSTYAIRKLVSELERRDSV